MWLDTLERLRAGSIKLETDYKEAVRQKGGRRAGGGGVLWCGGGALGSDAGKRGGGRPAALCHPGQGGHGPGAGVLHRGAEKQHPSTIWRIRPASGGAGTAGGAAGQPLRQIAERSAACQRSTGSWSGPGERGRRKMPPPRRPCARRGLWPGKLEELRGRSRVQDGRRPSGQGPAVRPGRRRPGGADRDEAVRQELSRLDRRQRRRGRSPPPRRRRCGSPG